MGVKFSLSTSLPLSIKVSLNTALPLSKKEKTEFCFKQYDRHIRFGTKTDKKHYKHSSDFISEKYTYLSL